MAGSHISAGSVLAQFPGPVTVRAPKAELLHYRRSNRITLTADGFDIVRGGNRTSFRWRDVAGFRVEGSTVRFDTDDDEAALPPYFELGVDDMAFVMNAWRYNALGQSHPAVMASRYVCPAV